MPQAIYFLDSDCVEYVKEDALCIYQRIDNFLTLIFDETQLTLVGFKLKGFKYVFQQHLKPLFELNDEQFITMASAIEVHFTAIGNEIFARGEEARLRAYKAALKLASNDKVKLATGAGLFKIAA